MSVFEFLGLGMALGFGLIIGIFLMFFWVIILGVIAWVAVRYFGAPRRLVGALFFATVCLYLLIGMVLSNSRENSSPPKCTSSGVDAANPRQEAAAASADHRDATTIRHTCQSVEASIKPRIVAWSYDGA